LCEKPGRLRAAFLWLKEACMVERFLWHPVLSASELGNTPVALELLGQDLVLWREERRAGQEPWLHAWADHCPHRGARLSLGKVLVLGSGAVLQCPYHGWQFAGNAVGSVVTKPCGRCVHVPSAPDFEPPPSHGVTAFEARERNGLIWVRLGRPQVSDLPASLMEPPVFVAWEDRMYHQVVCGPYTVGASAARVIDNFLDLTHFGFVHEGWLGDANHAQVQAGQVQESPGGVVVRDCRAWQPRGYPGAQEGVWVNYHYEVNHPFAAVLRKDATEGDPMVNVIGVFVRPDGDEACTVWFCNASLGDPSSDEEVRNFQQAVFWQDLPIVESQSPKRLPIGRLGPVNEVHGPFDRTSSAYRRYLKSLGVSVGVC
jgi:phenylpropionate dioxygenase-like ring-hydroxylating dioxygenase large terminal subunit